MTTITISKSPFHNAPTFDSDELMIASLSLIVMLSANHINQIQMPAFLTNDMPPLQVHACSSACADVLALCRLKNTIDHGKRLNKPIADCVYVTHGNAQRKVLNAGRSRYLWLYYATAQSDSTLSMVIAWNNGL